MRNMICSVSLKLFYFATIFNFNRFKVIIFINSAVASENMPLIYFVYIVNLLEKTTLFLRIIAIVSVYIYLYSFMFTLS